LEKSLCSKNNNNKTESNDGIAFVTEWRKKKQKIGSDEIRQCTIPINVFA